MKRGLSLNNRVLKVDGFKSSNRSTMFKAIGKEIADRYRDAGYNVLLLLRASGIALALMAALELDVPLVFARKKNLFLWWTMYIIVWCTPTQRRKLRYYYF